MGSEMLKTMEWQFQEGARRAAIAREKSRDMLNINALPVQDVENALNLARELCEVDPTSVQSWKRNMNAFSTIAAAHRRQWDLEVINMPGS
jgi:hypothetical protein